MKINSDIKAGILKSGVAPQKSEKKVTDEVFIGGTKDTDFLSIGDKLKSMKSSGDGSFMSALAPDSVEDTVREDNIRVKGALIGLGVGAAAGAGIIFPGAGIPGIAIGAVVGGIGGLVLGGPLGTAFSRLTWDSEKEKIMSGLIEGEKGSVDAKGDFEFIKGHPIEEKTLREATVEFLDILNKVGNGKTIEARDIFGELAKTADDKERLEEKGLMLGFIGAEDTMADGIENFKFVKENKNKDKVLKEASEDFSEILKTLGKENSAEAREIFARLDKIKPDERQEIKEIMFSLVMAENKAGEGIKNFDFIEMNKSEGKTLREAVNEFNNILGKAGNENTDEARKIFSDLEKIKDPEKRKIEKELIFSLVEAEDNAGEAVENFDFIKKYKSEDSTLKGAVREFKETLVAVGKENTGQARELFLKGQDENEVLSVLIKAEDDESDAKNNLKCIKENKDQDTSLMTAANEFNEILRKVGRRESYQAREIYGILEKTTDEAQKQLEKEVLFTLIDAEDDPGDAVNNFNYIKENKSEYKSLKAAAEEFNTILGKVGRKESYKARQIFGENSAVEKEVIPLLIAAENDAKQALENFSFIKEHIHKDHGLKDAVNEFNEILKKVGNNNTDEARQIFAELEQAGNIEEIKEEKDIIYSHIDAENELKQGVENFKFIKENKNSGQTLKEASDDFLSILNNAGDKCTDEVRIIFKEISSIENTGERKAARQDAVDIFSSIGQGHGAEGREIFREIRKTRDPEERQIEKEVACEQVRAENETSQGVANYKFIKENRKPGQSLKEASGVFLKILKEVGNNNTDKAREMFKKQSGH